MMKNRVKNILIVLLSISTVFLFVLNLGINPKLALFDPKPIEGTIFDSQALISDGILPDEVIVSFGDGEYTISHDVTQDSIWDYSTGLITSVFKVNGTTVSSVDQITKEDYRKLLDKRFVLLSFSAKINMTTILNSMGVGEAEDFVDNIGDIDSIYISLEEPIIVTATENGYTKISVEYLASENIDKVVDVIYLKDYIPYYAIDIDSDKLRIIPTIQDRIIPKPKVQNVLKNIDYQYIENIVNEFLQKEINLVREIDDGNGTIYLDEERVLKIYNNGYVEYTDSSELVNKDRNLFRSIEYALEFVSNVSGYNNSLYLKDIEEIEHDGSPGYRLRFGKITEGLKIEIVDDVVEDYVVIDVYNDHVRSLSQLFREDYQDIDRSYYVGDRSDNITKVLKDNIDLIREDLPGYDIEDVLDNLEFGRIVYYDNLKNEELGLMWNIVVSGHEYMIEID